LEGDARAWLAGVSFSTELGLGLGVGVVIGLSTELGLGLGVGVVIGLTSAFVVVQASCGKAAREKVLESSWRHKNSATEKGFKPPH